MHMVLLGYDYGCYFNYSSRIIYVICPHRVTVASPTLEQSHDCPSANEVVLKDIDEFFH